MSTDAWGIDDGYRDVHGEWHATSAETRAALQAAMGANPSDAAPPRAPEVIIAQAGRPMPLRGPTDLVLEDGTQLGVKGALPKDLPVGYHELRLRGSAEPVRLIVSPGRCHLPVGLPTWGWGVQLYAVRSAGSWGMGDHADLRRLARWATRQCGAGVLLVNPLFAVRPLLPQEPSPYYPASRRYRNPLYLRIEEAPGATEMGSELEPLAAAGRALNRERRIDRDQVFRLKMRALERLWSRFGGHLAFDRYCAEQGDALTQFATFCALAEHHGSGWRQWPAEHRRPDSSGVARFASDCAGRVRFHSWLQWLLDDQLGQVAGEVGLIQDLPIGVDPEGADAWAWQDLLATDVTVGAPPDELNPEGQDWGLPPFVPHALRSRAYGPWRETLRATLRHAAALRIDHVMGLFRLFWIPRGAAATAGAYVRYRAEELLAVLAVESYRARAVVIGEDLGTVEEGVGERMAELGILSYRLLLLEPGPPEGYPRLSLAAVTTHDLPTTAGLWSGADREARRALGLDLNEEAMRAIRERLRAMAGLADEAPVSETIVRIHEALARAPSAILLATLEDALAVEERPNMPGATGQQRPNWSLALPVPLEALERHPLARAIGRALTRPPGERPESIGSRP